MGRGVLAALLLAALLASASSAGEAWQCAAGVVTAYRQDPATGRWKTLVLPVTDQRFLVRRPGSAGPWELVWVGNGGLVLPCTSGFDPAGRLRCGTGDEFELDRKTSSFTSHLFGPGSRDLAALTAATVTGACTAP